MLALFATTARLFWYLLTKWRDPRVQILLDLLSGRTLYDALARQGAIVHDQFVGLDHVTVPPHGTAMLQDIANRTFWIRARGGVVLDASNPDAVSVLGIAYASINPMNGGVKAAPLSAFRYSASQDESASVDLPEPQRMISVGQSIRICLSNASDEPVEVSGCLRIDEVVSFPPSMRAMTASISLLAPLLI